MDDLLLDPIVLPDGTTYVIDQYDDLDSEFVPAEDSLRWWER